MKTLTKSCLYCHQNFEAALKEIKRGNGKFCCQSHASIYHGQKIRSALTLNTECAYCGKKFHKSTSKLTLSKSRLYFCCRSHKDLSQRLGGIKEIQPPHYGQSTRGYRVKAIDRFGAKCNRCGYDANITALVVHHKNRGRDDNSLVNLEVLCANCHAIEHWTPHVELQEIES